MLLFYWLEYKKGIVVADIVSKVLSVYFNKPITYQRHCNGSPYLIGLDKNISLSHSGKMLIFAVSDSIVGIDTEQNLPRDFIKISQKLGFDCQDITTFYQQWTSYECNFKIGNVGLPIRFIDVYSGYITAVASADKIINMIDIKSII